MFWDDIKLVTEQVEKYGLRKPFADLGGMERPCIADYDLTIATGDQNARYVALSQRPFDHIDPEYLVLNPEKGDPFIEDLPYTYQNAFGTAVCLNVIEHVENPFRVFAALYQIMKPNSLLIVETVFSFPYHPSPNDFWRYTPECLRHLGQTAGFTVLECDWRMTIPADRGIVNAQNNEPQEIRGIYATLTKGDFTQAPSSSYCLPKRYSNNEIANSLIDSGKSTRECVPVQPENKPISMSNPLEFHRLMPYNDILIELEKNPGLAGLTHIDLEAKHPEQQQDLLLGEYFSKLSSTLGKMASDLLYRAQWGYTTPEWFDHRHHFLNPDRCCTDFWAMSADLVLKKTPVDGRLLDLCSGDGFYDYHFFSKRASEVVGVEINQEAYCQALRLHHRAGISYIKNNVLEYDPHESYFDVVVIRGAIEHFSESDQQQIFKTAYRALKPGGWFCGDTPANPGKGEKQLESHENEWADEFEMRNELLKVFPHVEVLTYVSHDRITLFWQARR